MSIECRFFLKGSFSVDSKGRRLENPFIEAVQKQTVVDMKGNCLQKVFTIFQNSFFVRDKIFNNYFLLDVMVLSDIIEQAAGRQHKINDFQSMFRIDRF